MSSPVNVEVVVDGGLVAHRTGPGVLALVHLQVERGVEALQVVAGGGPRRDAHPYLAEGTHQRAAQ